jgi:hypothetical protein
MATASGPSAMGNATLQFVWPCPNSPLFDDKKGHQPFDILVDEKKAGAVFSCDYATMAIPAGTHAIRIQEPTLDLDGAFGRKGESFAVAPNETLYLLIPHLGGVGLHPLQIDGARAEAEIKLIAHHHDSPS